MISKKLEDEPMTKRRLMPWTIVVSLLLHAVGYGSLRAAPPSARAEPRKTQLRFDVVSRPQPKELEPKRESAKPAPAKPAPAKSKPRVSETKPLDEPDVATPVPPPVAASDGVTLTGDAHGNAFSMPLGSGGSLDATARPLSPAPVNVPAPTTPAPPPARAEPPLVPVGDLSSRPSPPSLGAALERNYPADARRRGLSGTAKVRARIDPDGVVRRVAMVEESGPGFGTACSRTLSGSRWAAPKDKAGRSVATEIRYTCRFVIEP